MLCTEASAPVSGFLWDVCSLLVSLSPAQSKLQKSSCCPPQVPFLTNRLFVLLSPHQSLSFISFNHHLLSLSRSLSPSLHLSLSFFFVLLCRPTGPLVPPAIGRAPMALRWPCPWPECHPCPRSASASPLHPPRGPVRSRSIDRQKSGMTTSVSADGALDPSVVRRPFWVHVTNTTGQKDV